MTVIIDTRNNAVTDDRDQVFAEYERLLYENETLRARLKQKTDEVEKLTRALYEASPAGAAGAEAGQVIDFYSAKLHYYTDGADIREMIETLGETARKTGAARITEFLNAI